MTVKCSFCGETDPNMFWKSKPTRCKTCHTKDVRNRLRKRVKFAVEYKGGKCEVCSYDKSIWALCFHHTDPNTKDLNFKNFGHWSKERIKSELDKCVLLCLNCHAEEHERLYEQGVRQSG